MALRLSPEETCPSTTNLCTQKHQHYPLWIANRALP